MAATDGAEPDAPFGDPVTDRINRQGHDPATLVTNMRQVRLFLWIGNGTPTALDDGVDSVTLAGREFMEQASHYSTVDWEQAVDAAGRLTVRVPLGLLPTTVHVTIG